MQLQAQCIKKQFCGKITQTIFEGDRMRKLTIWILCLSFLCIPVRASENEKLVALTFDDGPSGKYTRRLLDGLSERGAKATFFLCGYRIEQYPALTERIVKEGHEIGLHGYSHRTMENMNNTEILQEFEDTRALLPEECQITFVRSPGGLCGKCVQSVAEKLGLCVLHWSIDPKDWQMQDTKQIQKAILSTVRDGDVILLHDMSDSSVDAALAIIDKLQKEGFRFVTASELAKAKNVPLIAGKKYLRF